MLRPVGSASITAWLTIVWRVVVWTSTMGASPVTVTVSATVPTFMSTFFVTVNEPVSSRPSSLIVLNPVNENVTV